MPNHPPHHHLAHRHHSTAPCTISPLPSHLLLEHRQRSIAPRTPFGTVSIAPPSFAKPALSALIDLSVASQTPSVQYRLLHNQPWPLTSALDTASTALPLGPLLAPSAMHRPLHNQPYLPSFSLSDFSNTIMTDQYSTAHRTTRPIPSHLLLGNCQHRSRLVPPLAAAHQVAHLCMPHHSATASGALVQVSHNKHQLCRLSLSI